MSEATAEEAVLVDVDDGVATITLNRPEIRNALAPDIQQGILDALDELEDRDDARCIVFTGSEGVFCAGGDISGMEDRDDMSIPESVERINRVTHRLLKRVARFPAPTVAKVNGPAFGAGGGIALACDIQVASDEAHIGFGFRQVGLAVDSGTSYFLPRVVGENVAKELVFTGELVDAERAENLGLFNHVYPAEEFDERADEFIAEIASGPTVALRTSKRLVDQGLESSLDQALLTEATAQGTVFDTEDHDEGVQAFGEGRDPEFEGR